jgi:hypothetical protein
MNIDMTIATIVILFTSVFLLYLLRGWRAVRVLKHLGWSADDGSSRHLAHGLGLRCACRIHVLRVHHCGHQLLQVLELLDLRQGDLVAGLCHLQIADGGLILNFERTQRGLFALPLLRLCLGVLQGAVERVEVHVHALLEGRRVGRRGVTGIKLLELRRKLGIGVRACLKSPYESFASRLVIR